MAGPGRALSMMSSSGSHSRRPGAFAGRTSAGHRTRSEPANGWLTLDPRASSGPGDHHRLAVLAHRVDARVGLELVLVEVLISHPARTQHEAACQPAVITNPASKICISHDDSIAGPNHRLTAAQPPQAGTATGGCPRTIRGYAWRPSPRPRRGSGSAPRLPHCLAAVPGNWPSSSSSRRRATLAGRWYKRPNRPATRHRRYRGLHHQSFRLRRSAGTHHARSRSRRSSRLRVRVGGDFAPAAGSVYIGPARCWRQRGRV